MWRRFWSFLLATPCFVCGGPTAPGQPWCAACGKALPLAAPQPAALRLRVQGSDAILTVPLYTAARYEPPVSDWIKRLKFAQDLACAWPLGALLALLPAPSEGAIVVPMPLSRARQRERGYNQAAEIARFAAKHWRRPLALTALVRVRATAPQARLDAAGRRRNVAGAFAVPRRHIVHRRDVVLIDDVLTTGSTAAAAASALLAAGAASVSVYAVARA